MSIEVKEHVNYLFVVVLKYCSLSVTVERVMQVKRAVEVQWQVLEQRWERNLLYCPRFVKYDIVWSTDVKPEVIYFLIVSFGVTHQIVARWGVITHDGQKCLRNLRRNRRFPRALNLYLEVKVSKLYEFTPIFHQTRSLHINWQINSIRWLCLYSESTPTWSLYIVCIMYMQIKIFGFNILRFWATYFT